MYDIIVIGGGPAGLTAAIYARRANKSVLVIEKGSFGGQITFSPKVENIPGFSEVTGNEFAEKLVEQALGLDAEVECAEVLEIKQDDVKTVVTDSGDFEAKTVIIATGAKHRMLGLDREEEFVGEGISFCAVCDGAFYAGQDVAVIGGGNVAMDAARTAIRVGFERVYIVYRRTENELPARLEEIRHAKEEGVHFVFLHAPYEILEKDGYVAGMRFEVMELGEADESGRRSPIGTGRYTDISVDTVIVALGTGPNPIIQKSAEMDGIQFEVDRRGYFVVDPDTRETSIPTIFAGGDVAPVGASNAINAMGAGKKAAKAINEFLIK